MRKSLVPRALNVGAFFVLIYIASQLLPSGIASTIMATSAGALMLIAWPLLAERPSAFAVTGALVGFADVCVLLLEEGMTVDPWGVVASLAAILMSSTGFILTKRWAPTQSAIAVTSWQLFAGGILYVAVVAIAVAFVAWFAGPRHLPAATVGIVGLLNPVTGVALGTIVAAEPFGPRQTIGTSLVLLGVPIGQRPRPKRTPRDPRDTADDAPLEGLSVPRAVNRRPGCADR